MAKSRLCGKIILVLLLVEGLLAVCPAGEYEDPIGSDNCISKHSNSDNNEDFQKKSSNFVPLACKPPCDICLDIVNCLTCTDSEMNLLAYKCNCRAGFHVDPADAGGCTSKISDFLF